MDDQQYTNAKILFEDLRKVRADAIRELVKAELNYQNQLAVVKELENQLRYETTIQDE